MDKWTWSTCQVKKSRCLLNTHSVWDKTEMYFPNDTKNDYAFCKSKTAMEGSLPISQKWRCFVNTFCGIYYNNACRMLTFGCYCVGCIIVVWQSAVAELKAAVNAAVVRSADARWQCIAVVWTHGCWWRENVERKLPNTAQPFSVQQTCSTSGWRRITRDRKWWRKTVM